MTGPTPICQGAGGARMQDGAGGGAAFAECQIQPLFGKASYAHTQGRGEQFDGFCQSRVTNLEQRSLFGDEQLVGGDVLASGFHETERAVVDDEKAREETLGLDESVFGPAPQARATHFASRAVEPEHRAFRVFTSRLPHLAVDAEPVLHQLDITKRYAGLRHAEWTWIH